MDQVAMCVIPGLHKDTHRAPDPAGSRIDPPSNQRVVSTTHISGRYDTLGAKDTQYNKVSTPTDKMALRRTREDKSSVMHYSADKIILMYHSAPKSNAGERLCPEESSLHPTAVTGYAAFSEQNANNYNNNAIILSMESQNYTFQVYSFQYTHTVRS